MYSNSSIVDHDPHFSDTLGFAIAALIALNGDKHLDIGC